jgi:hypothetical protein
VKQRVRPLPHIFLTPPPDLFLIIQPLMEPQEVITQTLEENERTSWEFARSSTEHRSNIWFLPGIVYNLTKVE